MQEIIIRVEMSYHITCRDSNPFVHRMTDATTNVFQQLIWPVQPAYALQRAICGSTIDKNIFDAWMILTQYRINGCR